MLQALESASFDEFLEALPPRAADIWEPLLGIASLAGEGVLAQSKQAAFSLCRQGEEQERSSGERLLRDIRSIFVGRGVDRLASAELIASLLEIEESPWAEWRAGKPLSANGLASLLRPYEIQPRTIRLPDGRTPKGYHCGQFVDAFARYLPAPDATAATPPQPALRADSKRGGTGLGGGGVAAGERPSLALGAACGAVAAGSAGKTERRDERRALRRPTDAELGHLLALHRPELVHRDDITTLDERREIASLLSIEEKARMHRSAGDLDASEAG